MTFRFNFLEGMFCVTAEKSLYHILVVPIQLMIHTKFHYLYFRTPVHPLS